VNARQFHDRTAHTPYSVRTSTHTLDWDIKPFPFKVYTETPAVELPRTFDPIDVDTLTAIASPPEGPADLDLERLAALLYYSAGVTKKKVYASGVEVLFRAAASTGALYQTEVYVAAGEVRGLAPGLYHFCPGDFTLRRLRDIDVRGALARSAAGEDLGCRAAAVILSAIYWRNTWKYQARGFRHLFWDSGTMLANVLAAAGALGQAPLTYTGFVDDEVNHVLGVDAERETALELVALGPRGAPAPDPGALPPIAHATLPLSSEEVDYPILREMVEASKLASSDEVRAWRGSQDGGAGGAGVTRDIRRREEAKLPPDEARSRPPRASGPSILQLPPPRASSTRSLGDTIQHRGSARVFSHDPISALDLSTTLWAATRPISSDVPSGLVELFFIANAIEGVAPGAYAYRPAEHSVEMVRAGAFRDRASYLTLEQALGGDAAATIFFLAPLDALRARWGDRGYRLVNLEAGIAGGRAYLAAYAQGFGATGLTFYDQLVTEFFAPASAGMDAIFVTALGQSARQSGSPVIDRLSRPSRE
jgi:SagB-type dehydrogenase family enzyme